MKLTISQQQLISHLSNVKSHGQGAMFSYAGLAKLTDPVKNKLLYLMLNNFKNLCLKADIMF